MKKLIAFIAILLSIALPQTTHTIWPFTSSATQRDCRTNNIDGGYKPSYYVIWLVENNSGRHEEVFFEISRDRFWSIVRTADSPLIYTLDADGTHKIPYEFPNDVASVLKCGIEDVVKRHPSNQQPGIKSKIHAAMQKKSLSQSPSAPTLTK